MAGAVLFQTYFVWGSICETVIFVGLEALSPLNLCAKKLGNVSKMIKNKNKIMTEVVKDELRLQTVQKSTRENNFKHICPHETGNK